MSDHLAEWKPVWAMSRAEREDYAEFRASLEELGCACLTCLDVGLPCYHQEPHEMTRVFDMLRSNDALPAPPA